MIGHGEKIQLQAGPDYYGLVTVPRLQEPRRSVVLLTSPSGAGSSRSPSRRPTAKPAVPWCSMPSPKCAATGEAVETLRTVMRTPRPRQALVSLRRRRCSRRPSKASKLRAWQPALPPRSARATPMSLQRLWGRGWRRASGRRRGVRCLAWAALLLDAHDVSPAVGGFVAGVVLVKPFARAESI